MFSFIIPTIQLIHHFMCALHYHVLPGQWYYYSLEPLAFHGYRRYPDQTGAHQWQCFVC